MNLNFVDWESLQSYGQERCLTFFEMLNRGTEVRLIAVIFASDPFLILNEFQKDLNASVCLESEEIGPIGFASMEISCLKFDQSTDP